MLACLVTGIADGDTLGRADLRQRHHKNLVVPVCDKDDLFRFFGVVRITIPIAVDSTAVEPHFEAHGPEFFNFVDPDRIFLLHHTALTVDGPRSHYSLGASVVALLD